jgi:hypothetical protein
MDDQLKSVFLEAAKPLAAERSWPDASPSKFAPPSRCRAKKSGRFERTPGHAATASACRYENPISRPSMPRFFRADDSPTLGAPETGAAFCGCGT